MNDNREDDVPTGHLQSGAVCLIGLRTGAMGNDIVTAVLSWTGNQIGLDFPNEQSRAWAEGHAAELQGWMERFFTAYSDRPVVLDGYPSTNPKAIYVGRLLSLAANGLRAAFPDTPLQVEERTS